MRNKNVADLCNSCYVGKSRKLHVPLSNTNYIHLFELVHTDLWGLSPPPLNGGYTYYIAYVDAFSRYTLIHFLKKMVTSLYSNCFISVWKYNFMSKSRQFNLILGDNLNPN